MEINGDSLVNLMIKKRLSLSLETLMLNLISKSIKHNLLNPTIKSQL